MMINSRREGFFVRCLAGSAGLRGNFVEAEQPETMAA